MTQFPISVLHCMSSEWMFWNELESHKYVKTYVVKLPLQNSIPHKTTIWGIWQQWAQFMFLCSIYYHVLQNSKFSSKISFGRASTLKRTNNNKNMAMMVLPRIVCINISTGTTTTEQIVPCITITSVQQGLDFLLILLVM